MEKLQPTSKSFICALFGAMVLLLTGCETTNESIQLVQNQAEQGDADAQYALADTYLYYTDKEAAIQWYRKAADQGHIDAHMQLAHTYRYYKKDIDSALEWYRKAAELGDI